MRLVLFRMVGNELYSLHFFSFFGNTNKIFKEAHTCYKKNPSVLKYTKEVVFSNSSSRGLLPRFLYTLRVIYVQT